MDWSFTILDFLEWGIPEPSSHVSIALGSSDMRAPSARSHAMHMVYLLRCITAYNSSH